MAYRLTDSDAQNMDKSELVRELHASFVQYNHREPTGEEKLGIDEAADWVKGNLAVWHNFEAGLRDGTWDPAEGPRAVFSQGG
jgi:hypothetical protein